MDDAQLRLQLGRTIAIHRKALGLTQERLAEAVGVSAEWVSQMERGIGAPSLEGLVRLADALASDAPTLLAAALDVQGREVVVELVAELAHLNDAAVEVVAATARALRARWPKPS